jgi:hypothetical protein
MIKTLKYSGKLILSYQTRAEQLAINKLCELLDAAPIEDLVYILDGYDAREAAMPQPGDVIGGKYLILEKLSKEGKR